MRSYPNVSKSLIHVSQETSAGGCQDDSDSRSGSKLRLNRSHHIIHCREACSLRRCDIDVEFRFIHVCGCVLLADQIIKRNRRENCNCGYEAYAAPVAHRIRKHLCVITVQPGKETGLGTAMLCVCGIYLAQKPRAHHGSQCERNQKTYQNCNCGRNPKLVQESSGNTGHEGNWNKNNNQTERSGHNGHANFGRSLPGCFEGFPLLLFYKTENVFQDT